MALGSPRVEVQVIDESFYTPAAPGTIPFIFVATAQDKRNASGTGVAQGTTTANAGKVWVITSQRDLVDTFGTPLFYTGENNSAIHGGELNEYGLQAAYSVLGVSSRAYVARADVDLAQLTSQTSIPAGDPVAGTYWIDTDASLYGIFEWNSVTKKFVGITPWVIDNDTIAENADNSGTPLAGYGKAGDYAVVVTSDNANKFWYKSSTLGWVPLMNGFDNGKGLTVGPHYNYPNYDETTPTGSVWVKTTSAGLGANWVVKYYNGSTQSWTTVPAPIYNDVASALKAIDYVGGGKNIPVGSLIIDSDIDNSGDPRAEFKVWRKNSSGVTAIVSPVTTGTALTTSTFTIRETLVSTSTVWGPTVTITVDQNTTTSLASLIPAAISSSELKNIRVVYDSSVQKVTFSHELGGAFELSDGANSPLTYLGFAPYNLATKTGTTNLYAAPASDNFQYIATNWKPLTYEASATMPSTDPADGRLWHDANLRQVDILVNNGQGAWVGYRNYAGYNGTDENGPIISATEPTQQVGGHNGNYDLVTGDIWISTADPDRYGKDVYVWSTDSLEWVLQDVTDQSTPDGWLFADARWSNSGNDKQPATIQSLLSSNYVDPDSPDPNLYPRGMKLWNTRRSGFNVKKFVKGHLNLRANEGKNIRFGNEDMDNYISDRWITVSSNNEDGSGTFGRLSQRKVVVQALKALIDTNQAARDTDTLVFNLIATPGYPEAIQNMIGLNTERGLTAFVVGDTPFRLKPIGTELTAWGKNTNLAYDNGEDGGVSYDEYMAMFYPSGYTNDNFGNNIVVPPSHMILRMILNSDAKSYQWFAPAGTRRGGVDNATSVGYVDAEGEFVTVSLHERLRNVLHDVKINPIATLPGAGLVNFGQLTRARNASALDRINVARLVCYLRRQLSILSKPYLFEPNDAQTRREIKAAAESLMLELVGQRALYDFIVVCDESNNTPSRIDQNELWMDIAIEPVKSVEFIYIPLRIKNTGEIAAGA